MMSPVMGLGRASPLVVGASSSSSTTSTSSTTSSSSYRRGGQVVFKSSSTRQRRRLVTLTTTTSAANNNSNSNSNGAKGAASERFARAAIRESSVRAAEPNPAGGGGGGGGVSDEARQTEMRLGRAAMLGFFFTTLGDVMTRGEGPLEQLRDEETYVLNHINPVNLLKDALEVAGFYVEGVVILWVCLAVVFLAAVQQGLANPTRTYSSSKRTKEEKMKGAQRVDAMVDSVKTAVNDTVMEQKPYELFNGRLAMLGISAAFIGDKVSGGLGPLEQISGETGVPVIDAELFGAFFLFGVVFNVVATGVTVTSRAWQKGKSL